VNKTGYSNCIVREAIVLLGLFIAVDSSLARHTIRRKGDGGAATKAEINGPSSIAVDRQGNLYVYELAGGAVRRIDAVTQIVTTVAEECNPPWKKPRLTGCVGPVSELRADSDGNLLFAEFTYNRLSRFDLSARKFSVVAGIGDLHSSGDGGLATEAGVNSPHCFAWDSEGNIVVCDSGHFIRRIDAKTGIISTIAGSGRRGFGGDHGLALGAEFAFPMSVAVDRAGNIYMSDDTSNRIRRIDNATGMIESIAGTGPSSTGPLWSPEFCCEGALASRARFTSPGSLAFNQVGELLFVLSGRVCRIDKQGILTTMAGIGEKGFSGDGGPATKARIEPGRMAVDESGNLFITEYENNRVRRVDAKSGIITTVAGNGLPRRPPRMIL
jgi:DNA-binding beta-propeller fold protein YncE